MKKLPYQFVDVFTKQAFGGNQLAVFTEQSRGTMGPPLKCKFVGNVT
jgi:predicted PhzF superfamily epimerase YddE/YHI9